ncbi:hypothetical protein XELAEV_18000380mg [Xenopus laevis]|uniref:Nucleoside-diphosphate kinase n=1 Tax=Xenopus laevis TaxID=8355 RepID=A0A974BPY9_XENLA|nr:hypothetical protein XELAEV_18000380mg [Xenopus laevis]
MLYRLLRTLPRVSAASFHSVRHIMKPLVVFVLGGPGAGKGTQCERIVQVTFAKRLSPIVKHKECHRRLRLDQQFTYQFPALIEDLHFFVCS